MMTKKNPAYLYAIKLLAGQDYSHWKLQKKLRQKSYNDEDIQAALKEVIEKKYLKEEIYLKNLIKKLILKNNSPELIKRKCEQEKLYPELNDILEVYQQIEMTPQDQIAKIIDKKLSYPQNRPDINKKKGQIMRALQARGFSPYQANDLINSELKDL